MEEEKKTKSAIEQLEDWDNYLRMKEFKLQELIFEIQENKDMRYLILETKTYVDEENNEKEEHIFIDNKKMIKLRSILENTKELRNSIRSVMV